MHLLLFKMTHKRIIYIQTIAEVFEWKSLMKDSPGTPQNCFAARCQFVDVGPEKAALRSLF